MTTSNSANNSTSNSTITANETTTTAIDYQTFTPQKLANVMTKASSSNSEFLALVRQLAPATTGRAKLEAALLLAMSPARLELAKTNGYSSYQRYERTLLEAAQDKDNKTITMRTYNNVIGTKIGAKNQNTLLNSVQNALTGSTAADGTHKGLASATAKLGYCWSFDTEKQVFTVDIKVAKKQAGTSQTGKTKESVQANSASDDGADNLTSNIPAKQEKEQTKVSAILDLLGKCNEGDLQQLAGLLVQGHEDLLTAVESIKVDTALKVKQADKVEAKLVKAIAVAKVNADKLVVVKKDSNATQTELMEATENKSTSALLVADIKKSQRKASKMSLPRTAY